MGFVPNLDLDPNQVHRRTHYTGAGTVRDSIRRGTDQMDRSAQTCQNRDPRSHLGQATLIDTGAAVRSLNCNTERLRGA